MTDAHGESCETSEKHFALWQMFGIRYRETSRNRKPPFPRGYMAQEDWEWLRDAQIFLTSSDPSIGLPEVPIQ